jgi:hypothetical protein
MAITAAPHRRTVEELVRRVPVPATAATAVLQRDPRRVIGTHLGAPWTTTGIHVDLAVELFSGYQVARAMRIGVGPLIEDEDEGVLALPLWWQASDHPRLFPIFDGGLELRGDEQGTELRLVGSYRPPLGVVGRFADGVVGHRVVMASLDGFLSAVAERLTAELAAACGDGNEAAARVAYALKPSSLSA